MKVLFSMAAIGVLVFCAGNINADIPLVEREALIALYNSTCGDSWYYNWGWKTPPLHTDGFAMPGTEGTWRGITAESDHVTGIELTSDILKGPIPAAIGDLSELRKLILLAPYLSGPIPANLSNLKNLQVLHLGGALSGPIPASLGNLKNLQSFYLSGALSGAIPAELGSLNNLRGLGLIGNQLSGGIPSELGNLTNLEYLLLNHNQLSGQIPPELGNLIDLKHLDLSSNRLRGCIPSELGNLVNLSSNTYIGYNALYTSDAGLIAFLDERNPDWRATQTIAPSNVAAAAASTTAVNVNWDAIPYSGDTGGYRIHVGTEPGGPSIFLDQTADKTATSHLVTGLDPGTPYYFVISTRTDSHEWNQNAVDSDYSTEAFAQTYKHPEISLSQTRFVFGAESGGQTTKLQNVFVSNKQSGPMTWTAAANSWLGVVPAAGTGDAIMAVSVDATGLPAGTYTSQVTIEAAGATNSPQKIDVTLNVYAAGASSPPFGFFDTPTDGAVVAGAIPVTGWALDDVQVQKVEVKRSPHATDDPAAIGPDGLVYIGDAVFVEGARPDIEAAYPNYPLNYRAGWGYMMLTNFLPNQGNGPFTIHAFVYDTEGARVILGQKTITGDNANSILPFGTIDTPTQGGSASGAAFYNFGWALTPPPKMIPIDGSTIRVFVDGLPLGNPSYNHYRQDVAEAFPGLKNTNGAVGVYTLDTTTYANGVHTIAWGVTDDAGNSDGIGSRYFMVQNMGGAEIEGAAEAAGPSGVRRPLSEIGHILTAFHEPVYASKGYDLTRVAEMVQTGADGAVEIAIVEVERIELVLGREAMVRAVELGRWSGRGADSHPQTSFDAQPGESTDRGFGHAALSGYLVVGDELRPLPIGSTLDPRTGVFAWQPGPGFLGEYTFVFVRERFGGIQDKSFVRIAIKPRF